MVLIGTIIELINWPGKAVEEAIARRFERKGEKVVQANIEAVRAGREYAKKEFGSGIDLKLAYKHGKPKLFMTGNEALAYGALVAGCRFYSGYPITPASEILEWLSAHLPKFDGTVVQAEDEMSAIGMAIGASFAGVKAMCGTSGPGMSLKTEMLGLASMAEIPLVVVDVQRAGPSTGIPTRTEQADLWLAVYGSHGDAPRAVLAPVDVEDCFFVATEAFRIAEKLQIPVIILTDQFVAQRKESFPPYSIRGKLVEERILPTDNDLQDYKRFRITHTGVSPMALPGMARGEYTAVGIEHDEKGHPDSSSKMHSQMVSKRARKLELVEKECQPLRVYGDKDATIAILGWGSSKGVIKLVVNDLVKNKVPVKGIVPRLIHPLPVDALVKELKGVEKVVIVEQSFSGQFYKYLRANMDFEAEVKHYSRAGGIPLFAKEVYSFVCECAKEKLEKQKVAVKSV